jgi:hypothetical protein
MMNADGTTLNSINTVGRRDVLNGMLDKRNTDKGGDDFPNPYNES